MSFIVSTQRFYGEQLGVIHLSLPYRSDRNYIHSADIFDALTDLAKDRFSPDAYVESIVLRKQAVRQIQLSFQAMPGTMGTFSIRDAGTQVHGWFVETDVEVHARIPYDESPATAAVVGGLGYASFSEPVAGYTAFEQLLVLGKVAGGFGGREAWLCQINLSAPLLNQPLAVRLQRRTLERFVAFEIMQKERKIGCARCFLRS